MRCKVFIEQRLADVGHEILREFVIHEFQGLDFVRDKGARVIVLWSARLFEVRDDLGRGLCSLAGVEDKIIFVGAVDGAVDLVEWGEGAEGK